MPIIEFVKIYKYNLLKGLLVLIILAWPSFINEVFNENFNQSNFYKYFSGDGRLQGSPDDVNKTLESNSPTIINTLVFGGDIMLSRAVNQKMSATNNYNWPLESIATLFSEADLAVANLESPFLLNSNYETLDNSLIFKANPKSVQALNLAGFDVLSLANNHILNQGLKGLKDTRQILDEAGIAYTGLKENNLIIKEVNGIKFAFLAYSYDSSSSLVASLDVKQLVSDLKIAKDQSDTVIVIMHAGTEYSRLPNWQQKEFAHKAIDNGADLIVGHHPHWPQIIEKYQGKTIIYSLGNLVFDQMWSRETSEGLVAKVYFKNKIIDYIEYIPIEIRNYGQALIMTDELRKEQLLKNINVLN